MKDILKLNIKRREYFSPFSFSVLRDAVPDLFEQERRPALHDAALSTGL